MLRIDHTVYPPGREPVATNEIREGGLWYRNEQERLLVEAKKVIGKQNRKNEVRDLCIIFWEIVVVLIALYIVISKI